MRNVVAIRYGNQVLNSPPAIDAALGRRISYIETSDIMAMVLPPNYVDRFPRQPTSSRSL
jgi:hypothetical protein